MFLKFVSIILMLLISSSIFASFEQRGFCARSISLGNATVALENNLSSIYNNPAGIQHQKSIIVGGTMMNFYNLNDLQQLIFNGSIKINSHYIGIGLSRFGNKLYHEMIYAICFSSLVKRNLHIGIGLNYYSLEIQNYGNDSTFGLNFGILYKIFNNLNIGATIYNLNQPNLGKPKESLESSFTMGICYKTIPCISFNACILKRLNSQEEYCFGMEYVFNKLAQIRLGYEHENKSICAGFGFNSLNLCFNYAFRWHPWLQDSHAIAIYFTI